MADSEFLDQAVSSISTAATPDHVAHAGERFADPLVDAYSVAAASIGEGVRPSDPEVERDLPPGDAVAAASGLLTRPLVRLGRWWQELPGPVVSGSGEDAFAVLPRNRGATVVRNRRTSRFTRRTPLPAPSDVIVPPLPDVPWTRQLGWSLRRQRPTTVVMVLLSLVGGLAGLLLPLATAALFSYALPSGRVTTVAAIVGAFALGSVGGAAILLARNLNLLRLRDISDSMISTGVMARVLRLPVSYFRRTPIGDTLNRLLTVEQARALVDDGVPALILTSAFGVVNLGILLAISPLLAAGAAVMIGIVVSATLHTQIRARRSLTRLLQARSDSDTGLMALVESLVPIRVAGAEDRALERWSRLQSNALDALAVRLTRLDAQAPLLAAGPLLVTLVLVLSVVVLGSAVLPLAAFMTAYAAVVQLTVAMTMLTQNLVHLWELGPSYERLSPLASAPVERSQEARSPGPLRGAIALTDVVFGYVRDRPPLFDGLSLAIEPGEFVALVGPSGGGKSTVLRLLLGFESPWSGVVTVDGKDLASLDVAAVRRQIGTVLQSSAPFGHTIRECICGPLSLSDDEVWQALDAAGLQRVVSSLPGGLDAVLEQRGGTLSGGQRQRLMIARALAARPRVLIFDEATSALDNVTQEIVMRQVLAAPMTRIAVAHRLSTVERADRILVVSDGRIIESGTPRELRAADGAFARLAERQEI